MPTDYTDFPESLSEIYFSHPARIIFIIIAKLPARGGQNQPSIIHYFIQM